MTDIDMLLHDLEANLRMMEMADEEWVIQDGCSWRRIGTSGGRETDGTVLRPYVARDGHPDIQSAYGVLLHIRLSQPRNVSRLLAEIVRLRQQLAEAREAMAISEQAIIDWGNMYAPDQCREETVAAAKERIREAGGTLAYLADALGAIRGALKEKS